MAGYEHLYVVEKKLGQGAFGEVYRVILRNDSRRYALKVIKLNNYQVTLNDVLKEINVMKGMHHRNILTIFGAHQKMDNFGRWVESVALQMEFCPNGDLTHFLQLRNGTLLSRQRLVGWMKDLASAVEYIHNHGIIHRDLKPDNILLDQNSVLRISDFGISKVMTHFYATTRVGTPGFVAPEVISGKGHNMKVDIYSLGKVFICMASLKRIPGNSNDVPKSYGEGIVNVMASCIRTSPDNRPTAGHLHASITKL